MLYRCNTKIFIYIYIIIYIYIYIYIIYMYISMQHFPLKRFTVNLWRFSVKYACFNAFLNEKHSSAKPLTRSSVGYIKYYFMGCSNKMKIMWSSIWHVLWSECKLIILCFLLLMVKTGLQHFVTKEWPQGHFDFLTFITQQHCEHSLIKSWIITTLVTTPTTNSLQL